MFISLLFVWLGAPFFMAMAVHGALSIWALVYAGRQISSGRWVLTGNLMAAGIYERLFRWKLLAAHGVLLLADTLELAGGSLRRHPHQPHCALIVMVGVFKTPRRRPGPVDLEGVTITGEKKGDGKDDPGVSDDWGS